MRSARFLSHMNHVSVSPTDGNAPTQGQRKTLTTSVTGVRFHELASYRGSLLRGPFLESPETLRAIFGSRDSLICISRTERFKSSNFTVIFLRYRENTLRFLPNSVVVVREKFVRTLVSGFFDILTGCLDIRI